MEAPKTSGLSEEQRKRIEENRLKALERKRANAQLSLGKVQAQNSNVSKPTLSSVAGVQKPTTTIIPNFNNQSVNTNVNGGANNIKVTNFYKSASTSKPNIPQSVPQLSMPNESNSKPGSTQFNGHSKSNFSSALNSGVKKVHATFSMISRKRFKVELSYHPKVIEILKSIPSKAYDLRDKTWNFKIEDHDKLVKALTQMNYIVTFTPLPPSVLKLFLNCPENTDVPEADLSGLDPKLKESLLPFQKIGVYFGIQHGGRVLIADDMGLGKTIQSIAIASYYIQEWPLLVVCPSSVRFAWLEAFHQWLPTLRKSEITMVENYKTSLYPGKVFMMSYDMLARKKADIEAKNFKVIIFDECHFLKNYKTARTKAAQAAAKNAKRVILLSGTPCLSRPVELYTQIRLIKNQLFFNYTDFGIRYCNGKSTTFGWDFTGSSNMTEFHLILKETVMIRRLKSEVLTQLPPKRRQVIMLDPSKIKINKKHFDAYSKEMSNVDLKSMEKRGILLQYFSETGAVKVPAVCEYINDVLESDNKFLLFAHHKIVLDEISRMLSEKCIGFMRIDGGTPSETRKLNVDRFQLLDSCRVALLSITAANAGLNLCAASLVIFAELFWNPGILTQAEDRAHRIGQQDSVVVQYLVAEGTSDDHMWPLIQEKLNTLSKAGLSKDNFMESDTYQLATTSEAKPEDGQKTIEDYFMTNDENDEFLRDINFDDFCKDFDEVECEPVMKKPHVT